MNELQNIIAGLRFDIHNLEQRIFKIQSIAGVIMTLEAITIIYLLSKIL
jgi:hypothetical protein